jgi:hypothetical protein
MNARLVQIRRWRGTGALTAFLLLVLTVPSARATCGSHVHVAGKPSGMAEPTGGKRTSQPDDRLPKPCSGPECSGGGLPWSVPPAPAPSMQNKVVHTPTDLCVRPDPLFNTLCEFTSQAPQRRESSVYRPPRLLF